MKVSAIQGEVVGRCQVSRERVCKGVSYPGRGYVKVSGIQGEWVCEGVRYPGSGCVKVSGIQGDGM